MQATNCQLLFVVPIYMTWQVCLGHLTHVIEHLEIDLSYLCTRSRRWLEDTGCSYKPDCAYLSLINVCDL